MSTSPERYSITDTNSTRSPGDPKHAPAIERLQSFRDRNKRPRIASDEDVAAFLKANYPEVAKEFAKQAANIERQQKMEAAHDHTGHGFFEWAERPREVKRGAWIDEVREAICPGCGKEEFLTFVSPLLTPPQAKLLYMHYVQGLSYEQLCKELGAKKSTLGMRMLAARKRIMDSLELVLVPTRRPKTGMTQEDWERLVNQDITIYRPVSHRPAVKAHVCACGRHLQMTNQHLRHLKNGARLRCDYCGKVYTKEEWASIYY